MKRERKNQIESIGTDEHASIEQCFIAGIEGSVEAKQALDQQRLCHRAGIPYLGFGALRNLLAKRSSSDLCIHYGSGSGPFLQSKVTSPYRVNRPRLRMVSRATRRLRWVTQGYAC
jgi:hypothetical protein